MRQCVISPGKPGTFAFRVLIGYHAGYPDPKKNGHEVMCLPRDRVSAQGAMALMEAAASHCGPIDAGFIGIVEQATAEASNPRKTQGNRLPGPSGRAVCWLATDCVPGQFSDVPQRTAQPRHPITNHFP